MQLENEKLSTLIKSGNDDIPLMTIFLAQKGDQASMDYIWERCIPLVKRQASEYAPYSWEPNRWCEYNDLVQSGYLAFRHALEKYKPVEGTPFKSYFIFWLKEYIRRELGIANSRRKELLLECSSLDVTLDAADEDENSDTFIDLLEDEQSQGAFRIIENYSFRVAVRVEVNKLPEPERSAIVKRYFGNKEIKAIAQDLSTSETSAQRYIETGLRLLRHNRVIQYLYAEIRHTVQIQMVVKVTICTIR